MRAWAGNRLGGALVDPAVPQVSLLDHGLLLGDGLFETVLTQGSKAMALGRHLERLATSAQTLDMSIDVNVIREAVLLVLNNEPLGADDCGRLRITVSSGVGPLGMARGDEPRYFVLWEPLTLTAAPARLLISDVVRNEHSPLVGIKHTSWIENVVAHKRAVAGGYTDALLLNLRGQVCETATSNVFIVKNGTVLTPPLSSGCLSGTVRRLLIEQIPLDFRFAEMPLSLDEVLAADEVFLTSSLRLVQPVEQVGDTRFVTNGEMTARLTHLVVEAMEQNHD